MIARGNEDGSVTAAVALAVIEVARLSDVSLR
jgi:hypothetical protein